MCWSDHSELPISVPEEFSYEKRYNICTAILNYKIKGFVALITEMIFVTDLFIGS